MAASRKLTVEFIGETSQLQRAFGRATKSSQQFGKQSGNVSARVSRSFAGAASSMLKFTAATAGLASAGAAVAGIGKATIEFDRAMRNVNSIAQVSEKRLGKLEKRVLRLAGKTAQAPQTLAEGLYDLVSSGFDANESMKVLASAAKAATAGLTTTEVSTKAVAAVLNAYHRPAKDAAKVSDTLFRTVDRGVISFEDLASNIGDVLPFAASLNVGLQDVGASIATMTKAGISPAETMTRIKDVMTSLIKPSEGLQKAFDKLGVASGQALIKQEGFQGALEALAKVTGGSKAELAKLFPNVRALGGALALTGKNAKGAGQDLKGMRDSAGATDRALEQQSKSISQQWNKVKAVVSAVAISIGSAFIPASRKALRALSKFGQDVSRIFEDKDLSFGEKLEKGFDAAKRRFGPLLDELGRKIKQADLPEKLAHAVEVAAPKIADAAARAAPRAAAAFINAFQNAGPWGKLVTVGFIAAKLGAFRGAGGIAADMFIGSFRKRAGGTAGNKMGSAASGAAAAGLASNIGGDLSRRQGKITKAFTGMGRIAGRSFGVAAAAYIGIEVINKLRDLNDQMEEKGGIEGLLGKVSNVGEDIAGKLPMTKPILDIADAVRGDKGGSKKPSRVGAGTRNPLNPGGGLGRLPKRLKAHSSSLRAEAEATVDTLEEVPRVAAHAARAVTAVADRVSKTSKVPEDLGRWVGDGIVRGIEKSARKVGKAVGDLAKTAKTGFQDAMKGGLLFPIEAEIARLEAKRDRLQAKFDRQDRRRERRELQAAIKQARAMDVMSTSTPSVRMSGGGGMGGGRARSRGGGFAVSNIVQLGKQLQRAGFQVGEHPAFGGVHPVHVPGSFHDRGLALDVNADGRGQAFENRRLTELYNKLKGMPGVVELLWQVKGHFDHLHVAMTATAKAAQKTVKAFTAKHSRGGGGGGGFNRIFPAHGIANQSGKARMTPGQVMALAMQVGFTKSQARRVAEIAKGESNFFPGIVASDNGIGLTQITPWAAFPNHSDPLFKLFQKLGGEKGMRNPVNNLRMAKAMFDRGGWAPWFGTRFVGSMPNLQPSDIGRMAGPGKTFVDPEKTKQRAEAIKQAKEAMKEFIREQKRAAKLARIDVQIKGLEQIQRWKEALDDIASTIRDKVSAAADAFADKWENTVGKRIDETNRKAMQSLEDMQAAALDSFDQETQRLIANSPAARALAALQAESDRIAREQQDRANKEALEDARRSGDPRAIRAAQEQIAETERQRQITLLTQQAEAQRAQIEAQRAKQRTELERQQAEERTRIEMQQAAERERIRQADTAAFTSKLETDLNNEFNTLKARGQNYATFVNHVNAILSRIGDGSTNNVFSPDASAEAAINAGVPMNVLFKPGSAGFKAQWRQAYMATHGGQLPSFAGGGVVPGRLGEPMPILAHGGEIITDPRTSRGGQAGAVNFYGPVTIGSRKAAEAMANRLAFRMAFG